MAISLLAVAVIVSAETGVRSMVGRLGPAPEWPTAEMGEKGDQLARLGSVDLLFMGSSVASFGIDPSVIQGAVPGIANSYNAAVPFGSFEVQRLWFEAAIKPNVSARIVVIEISPSVLLYRSKASFVPEMVRSIGYRHGAGQELGPVFDSALVRYAPYLRDPLKLAALGLRGTESIVFDDGQGRNCEPYRSTGEQRTLMADDFAASMADSAFVPLAELERLVKSLQTDDVIFAILPVHDDFFEFDPMLRPQWEKGLAAALSLAADWEIGVIDAGALEWPTGLFSDPLHLNPAGAERLSEVVAAGLTALSTGQPTEFRDRRYDGSDCSER